MMFYPIISRKPLETSLYKAFEAREMFVKDLPYISRTSPVHFIFTAEQMDKRISVKMV